MSERLEQDEEADGAEITDNLTLLEKGVDKLTAIDGFDRHK